MSAVGFLLSIGLLLFVGCAVAQTPAKCKRLPVPYTVNIHGLHKISWPGATVSTLYMNQFNGPYDRVGEHAWLSIDVGSGFPIHSHPKGNAEFLYTINGTGLHEVLGPDMTAPESAVMQPGTMSWVPPGGIHKVTNTGDEPLVLLCINTVSVVPFTVYEAWPPSLEAARGAGVEVPMMPWEASCPPGHELDEAKEEL